MRYTIMLAAAVACLLATGPATAVASNVSLTVELHEPDGTIVSVLTDSTPRRWRHWPVRTSVVLNREDRCRSRFDARRVLLGQHLTAGMPRRCESRWTRIHVRPDAYRPGR